MNPPPAPLWPWQKVLSLRIEAVHSTWDRTAGADYRLVGLELENRIVFNLTAPHNIYEIDSTTVPAIFPHEFGNGELTSNQIAGRSLRAILYTPVAESHFHRVAVLDDGSYLAANPGFNYTEFAYASFHEWKEGVESNLLYGNPPDFKSLSFFNEWTHERVNPFAIHWT